MKGRKAVSPIVATLLLILIAVAAAVVLYAWVSDLTSNTKNTQAQNTGAAFVVEAAKLVKNGTQAKLNVTAWVRNVGNTPISAGNWSVYILTPQNLTVVAFDEQEVDELEPGELTNITLNLVEGDITVGNYYVVKVVSPLGTSDTITVRAE